MKVSQRGHWGEEQDRVICGLTGTSSGYCKETVVSWCFKPGQPHRIISGLRETFLKKRHIVDRTNKAEIRPEE